MKIVKIGAARVILSARGEAHNYFGWPTVARLGDGRLAVVASGFREAHVCPFGKTVIAYSADEGAHYSAPVPAIDTVLDDRDGGICVLGEHSFLVTSFNNTVAFQRAHGGDAPARRAYLDTVSPEAEKAAYGASFAVTHDGGKHFSAPFHVPVTSPHGPCLLADGTVLFVGRVFDRADGLLHETEIEAWRIDPDTGAARLVGRVPDAVLAGETPLCCEPHAIALPDGRLLCHIRVQPGHGSDKEMLTLFQSASDDGGRTWSMPVPLLPPQGGAPAHLFLHSSGVLISAYGYRGTPAGVRVMCSADGGKTWQKDLVLFENDLGWDIGYPATAELADGTLHTVFYAHTEKGGPAEILAQDWRLVFDR